MARILRTEGPGAKYHALPGGLQQATQLRRPVLKIENQLSDVEM
jgi:hypothetical protein